MNRKLWRKSKVNHSSGFNIVSYFYVRDLGYIELHSVIQLYSFPRTLRNFHKCSGLKDQLFFPSLKLRAMSGIGRAILSPNIPGVCRWLQFLMAHKFCYPLAYLCTMLPLYYHFTVLLLFLSTCLSYCVQIAHSL